MSEPLPDQIGPYQIIRLLGMGGMAQVYQARKVVEGVGLVVALKIPRQHIVMDVDARERFLKEARITARMGSHASIVQILDVGVDDGLPYMAMEYVTGVDLAQLCEAMIKARTRWSEPAILWVLASVVQGLKHAWGAEVEGEPLRIVHRDISPSNVVLTHEGYVKVTDFGISRMAGMDTSGSIRGKARYMPCEQLQGRATSASDMYAVGAIGYELIEGKRFRHDKQTQDEMFLAAFSGERPEITRTDVSPRLVQLVEALLDPNEKTRIQNPVEAWAELKTCSGLNLVDPDPVRMLLEEFFGQRRRSGHTSIQVRIHPELVATKAALAAAAAGMSAAQMPGVPEPVPEVGSLGSGAGRSSSSSGADGSSPEARPVQRSRPRSGVYDDGLGDVPRPRQHRSTVRAPSSPAVVSQQSPAKPEATVLLDDVVGTPSSGPVIARSGSTVPQAPTTPITVGGDAAGSPPFPTEPTPSGLVVGGPSPASPRRSEPRVWPVVLTLGLLGLLIGGGLTIGALELGAEDSQPAERSDDASGVPVAAPATPDPAAAAPDVDGGAPSDAVAAVDPASAVAAAPTEVADGAGALDDEAGTEPDEPAPTAKTTEADESAGSTGAADEADDDADAVPDDVEPTPALRAKARSAPVAAPRVDVHARLTLVDEVELRIGTKVQKITGDKTIRMRTGSKRLSVRVPGSRTWNSTTVKLEPGRSYLLRLYSKRVELTPLGGGGP
ncbi:MAG: protein kinase [Nannocystaceae bacterium]